MAVGKSLMVVPFSALLLLCSCAQGGMVQENRDLRAKVTSMEEKLKEKDVLLERAQQQLDLAKSDLAELEKKIQKLYKDKHTMDRILRGQPADPPQRQRVDGKVITYSKPTGAVVINVGKDDGVLEGMSFSIYRPGKFVATAIAKRVEKNLTVADITLMQVEPQPGDECANRAPMVGKEETAEKSK